MFMRYYVELPVAASRVEAALVGDPAGWLPGLADDARRQGHQLLAEAGIQTPVGVLSRGVVVKVGRPVRFPSKLAMPISWEPAESEVLLPDLDADLEVGELGPARTQVGINATYTPPLGVVGRTADRLLLLLHRLAEATVKRFLDQVGAKLLELAGEPNQGVEGHGAAGAPGERRAAVRTRGAGQRRAPRRGDDLPHQRAVRGRRRVRGAGGR